MQPLLSAENQMEITHNSKLKLEKNDVIMLLQYAEWYVRNFKTCIVYSRCCTSTATLNSKRNWVSLLAFLVVLIVNEIVISGQKSAVESRLWCSYPAELFVPSVFYCEVRGTGRQLCYSLSSQLRGLLLNTEQLVCPQQCNRIWERPAGHYHHRSVWPTKSAKAPSPTAVSAKQLLRVHSKLL